MYDLNGFMRELEKRNPVQEEYIQAVREVVASVIDVVNSNERYLRNKILDRIVEPNAIHEFRVEWEDDNHQVQVNRGWRVQFNNAIGPYKGGIRFQKNVTLGTLKFLGFEQVFKNSLTSLPMGGAKGGSDFDPTGKSESEIRRFCQSFMRCMFKYIGPEIDIPAGDMGVGGREVGFMFGEWKRLTSEHVGVLTGKSLACGGSLIRPEATGFGSLYFANEMLKRNGDSIKGKTVAVSGFGNVAWGAVLKANELGAKVVTISGPDGYVYDEDGISGDKIGYMLEMRSSNRNIVEPYVERFPSARFFRGKKPWERKTDIAIPCACQNELDINDAKQLVSNGVGYVVETSNMGCVAEAVDFFIGKRIPFAPGKAANAGGVSVSGLEMTQNSMKCSWSAKEVDDKLKAIMENIHKACVENGADGDYVNYVKGANIAGFRKVADAMCDMGF